MRKSMRMEFLLVLPCAVHQHLAQNLAWSRPSIVFAEQWVNEWVGDDHTGDEWMNEEKGGINGTVATGYQVVSTCIPFVTLCSISSISSRQTIVTRIPRDTRVPLLARVLWVHVPYANAGGKQEPPDPHGSGDRTEEKRETQAKRRNLCLWDCRHSLHPCHGKWSQPQWHLARVVSVEASSGPSCLQSEGHWKGCMWFGPFLIVSNQTERSSKPGHFHLPFYFGQTSFQSHRTP